MTGLKIFSLCCFAFGVALMSKHYGFVSWMEELPWLSFPMIILGAVGLVLFMGDGEL